MNKRENYKKIFYSKEVERYARIICDIAKEAWNLKLADTTGFSISQRIPNTDIVLVDKSGTGFRRNKINESDLLLINLKGDMLYQPSKTNPRKAPVNIEIHLAGYRNSRANGCVHWHDPYTNAFACLGEPISPFTLQSKLIGIAPCVLVEMLRKLLRMAIDLCAMRKLSYIASY